MSISTSRPGPIGNVTLPSTARMVWLIAQRAALESLRDRMTLYMSAVFALVLPVIAVLAAIRPQAQQVTTATNAAALGTTMSFYLLGVGLMPAGNATSIASGVFAGENERGNLAPLLATPASNGAIFFGKVFGAVLPPLFYAAIAEVVYLVAIALLMGADKLTLLPTAFSVAMVAFVPCIAVLGASLASVISSRVRTYQGAQTLTALVLYPVMIAVFALAALTRNANPWLVVLLIVALAALDAAIIALGAATWRREEVMARR